MSSSKKKKGRPKNDSILKKKNRIELRVDDNDKDLLLRISLKTGESVAEIIRKSIKMYYNLIEFRD